MEYQAMSRVILGTVDGQYCIPEWAVRLCNSNLNHAMLLKQLVFWSEHTSDPDGFIYKSMKDWKQEACLSRWHVEKAVEKINADSIAVTGKEVIEVELRAPKGKTAPTLHYRIVWSVFHQWICNRLAIDPESICKPVAKAFASPLQKAFETGSQKHLQASRKTIQTVTTDLDPSQTDTHTSFSSPPAPDSGEPDDAKEEEEGSETEPYQLEDRYQKRVQECLAELAFITDMNATQHHRELYCTLQALQAHKPTDITPGELAEFGVKLRTAGYDVTTSAFVRNGQAWRRFLSRKPLRTERRKVAGESRYDHLEEDYSDIIQS